MTEMVWHAREKTPGNDISDVISGEFFPDDDRPSLPLVREALQNAMDAGRCVERGGEPLRVRIALRTGDRAVPSATGMHWFGSLRSHLGAERNGLREAPGPEDPCGFLVVEDFGTVGLTGDFDSDDIDGDQNNFVDFLRSDGRTRKISGEQGSWGVGKNVFPRCSRINSYIAFTVRRDDLRRLVMGKCILKIRRVGDRQYQPPIYLSRSWDAGMVPMPHECSDIIARLRSDFCVTRDHEPGLTLVMPWVTDAIREQDILEDVVSQFYYPILAGRLRVDLDLNGTQHSLGRDSIVEVSSQEPSLEQVRPHVELAKWAQSVTRDQHIELEQPQDPTGPQKWDQAMLPDDRREQIKDLLDRRERVALRVPLHVRHKGTDGGDPVRTHFNVYLEHDDLPHRDSKPRFIREMLCINEVRRAGGAQKIRSLVVIEDTPIAELLRNAEPPNHSDWAAGTSNFKGVYIHGNHVVTFVKSAVRSIMSMVRSGDDVPDATVAIDYFSRPKPEESMPAPGRSGGRKKGEEPDPPPVVSQPAAPKRFRIVEVDSGFKIVPGDDSAAHRSVVTVSMAYDVFAGSPWTQYEPADFDLTNRDRSGIGIATSGAVEWEATGPNRLEVRTAGRPFEVYVTGFDPNRDLIVKARAAQENSDGDPAVELHEES